MAQLCKEKRLAEAETLLCELRARPCSPTVLYYLLQIYLTQGKLDEALALLPTLEDCKSFRLGVVSALVTLLASMKRAAEAGRVLEAAVEHYGAAAGSGGELRTLLRESANFQLRFGNWAASCEVLERMRAMEPSNFIILSRLINIYSKFDGERANR